MLTGLAAGDGVLDIRAALWEAEERNKPHPATPLLELAGQALRLATGGSPPLLAYDGLRERLLPEVPFAGRVAHRNSQYMLHAAAALNGGLEPDIGRDTDWWGSPAWEYAYYAFVIYLRAAAERTERTAADLARELATRA